MAKTLTAVGVAAAVAVGGTLVVTDGSGTVTEVTVIAEVSGSAVTATSLTAARATGAGGSGATGGAPAGGPGVAGSTA